MVKRIIYISLFVFMSAAVFTLPKVSDYLPPRGPDPAFSNIPTTLEEFLKMRDRLAYTPEGGATMFIVSMMIFTQNETLGKQCFTITLDKSRLQKAIGGYKDYDPEEGFSYFYTRLRDFPYIPFSYIEGTGYLSGYTLPSGTFSCRYSTNPFSMPDENTAILQVNTSGDEAPREIIVTKNNRGVWKVKSYEKLFHTVTAPLTIKDDEL